MYAVCYPKDFKIDRDLHYSTKDIEGGEFGAEFIEYEDEDDLKQKVLYHNYHFLVIYTRRKKIRIQYFGENFDVHAIIEEGEHHFGKEIFRAYQVKFCGLPDILDNHMELKDHSECSI